MPAPPVAAAPDAADAGESRVTAAAELPDTPAGTAAGDWLVAFNEGGEDAVRSFLAERFTDELLARLPVAALVAFHLQSRELYGTLAPSAVVESEPHRLVLLADGSLGEEAELTVEVEEAEPHRISALRLVGAGPPSQ